MCGIFAYYFKNSKDATDQRKKELQTAMLRIQHRGPDNTKEEWVTPQLYYAFHRLAINGLGHDSDEPLIVDDVVLICNGEIYNYPDLVKKHEFNVVTHNDCEVIIHMYRKFGISKCVERLDGVFSFVLYDRRNSTLYVANDPIGIRPLYQGFTESGDIAFASEPIALRDICDRVQFFPPGHYAEYNNVLEKLKYYRYFYHSWNTTRLHPFEIIPKIREKMEASVRKRVYLTERPIACLLSGGLDSSIVASLLSKFMKEQGRELHTFSIGLDGSPDLKYAREMATYLGSTHHEVKVTEEEFLAVIPDVIRAIQSYDVTTVRASCGNYLVAKYIKEHTDFVVIFNGDVSEEINGSYFYSYFAPNDYEFFKDNTKLITEVHKYDVLRSARCIEHFGMEARTPFADKDLVNFVMSIAPKYKRFGPGCHYSMEKMLFRQAFSDILLPQVAWRPKTAFSDGVSKKQRSWHQIIAEHVDKIIDDREYEMQYTKWGPPVPFSKEAFWYRKIYHELLGNRLDMAALIGEYWMPRFGPQVNDPSARELQK